MQREVDLIVVHCAATPPTADIGASEIDRWHRAKGWWGCGYHFIIRRNGKVESEAKGDRCRPVEKAGAHVGDCGAGWNKRSLAICLVGGVNAQGKAENNFTPEQFESLKNLLIELRKTLPKAQIRGHRDIIKITGAPPKDCPSFEVRDWLKTVKIEAL